MSNPDISQSIAQGIAMGLSPEDAEYEAQRAYRLTTGDCYAFRTDEELEEMRRVEADQIQLARQTAGVCDEFPMGEFAVPGFNCDFDYDYR